MYVIPLGVKKKFSSNVAHHGENGLNVNISLLAFWEHIKGNSLKENCTLDHIEPVCVEIFVMSLVIPVLISCLVVYFRALFLKEVIGWVLHWCHVS